MWPSRSNTIHFPSGDKSRAIHVPSLVSKSISRVAPLALVVSHSAADFSCASSSAPLVNKATSKVRTSFLQLGIRQSMSRLSCGRINLPFRPQISSPWPLTIERVEFGQKNGGENRHGFTPPCWLKNKFQKSIRKPI